MFTPIKKRKEKAQLREQNIKVCKHQSECCTEENHAKDGFKDHSFHGNAFQVMSKIRHIKMLTTF